MKRGWLMQALIGIVTAATLMVAMWWMPRIVAEGKAAPDQSAAHALQQGTSILSGDYQGSVALNSVYQGSFDINPVATPSPMDLGQIDLGLHLEQSGGSVTGFVMLDRSLVFTTEATIMVTPVGSAPGLGTPTPTPQPLAIGPQVVGAFDGSTLRLVSQEFTMMLNGREIRRQFSLTSDGVPADGATLTGTYRETIWGYAPEPSTVIGSFWLQRPVFVTPTPGTTTVPSPTKTTPPG